MPNPHDPLFHLGFAAPAAAGRLLRHVLPAAVWRSLAFGTAVPWPQKLVSAALRTAHSDHRFRTKPRRRSPRYVILEHKSTPDRFVGLQVLGYHTQTWQDERRNRPRPRELPPVVAVVVHHGPRPYRGPRDVGRLVAPFPVRLRLPFCVVDLARTTERELLRWPLLPFERLVLLFLQYLRGRKAAAATAALRRWAPLLQAVARSRSARDRLQALSCYILETTDLSPTGLAAVLGEIVGEREANMITTAQRIRRKARREGRLEGREEGIERGLEKGRLEGRIEVLLQLLTARFGPLPAGTEAQVREADAATMDHWVETVLKAKTLRQALNGHAAGSSASAAAKRRQKRAAGRGA